MLGFDETRQKVKEPFASELREALKRAQEGLMSDTEKECEERLGVARDQYSFSWQ